MSKRARNGNGGRASKRRRVTRTRGFAFDPMQIGGNGGGRARFRNPRTAGFLGIENKFYDTKLLSAALTNPADVTGGEHDPSATIALNTVTQGDGEQQRDGRQISMISLHIRGLITVAKQNTQTDLNEIEEVFIAIVLDTQTNAAQFNSENVYINKAASGILATNLLRNLQFSKRFRILKIKKFMMGQVSATNVGAATTIEIAGTKRAFKMDIKLNGLKVNYSGTTETIANIVDNSIHVLAFVDSTQRAPLLHYNARLRFVG